jgi:hypothetical protein
MPQLYNVSFTTLKLKKVYNSRGKLTAEETLDTPITMTALPLTTAMQYAGCDNYVRTDYVAETRYSGSSDWAAPATHKRKLRQANDFGDVDTSVKRAKPKASKEDAIAAAARSGDLSAAISK